MDFTRPWRIVISVTLENHQDITIDAVFLDIKHEAGKSINGVAIEVNSDEMARLDFREQFYERIDITKAIRAPVKDGRFFTCQGKPEFFIQTQNCNKAKILLLYLDIVYRGVWRWRRDFLEVFKKITEPYDLDKGS